MDEEQRERWREALKAVKRRLAEERELREARLREAASNIGSVCDFLDNLLERKIAEAITNGGRQ